mmetsp:Transcript_9820/g.12817  ORF Transcript_9820/g.12817 Transcript_9820/m.12817 type:complete len:85 (+) Transcript_9820:34-288(+)
MMMLTTTLFFHLKLGLRLYGDTCDRKNRTNLPWSKNPVFERTPQLRSAGCLSPLQVNDRRIIDFMYMLVGVEKDFCAKLCGAAR